MRYQVEFHGTQDPGTVGDGEHFADEEKAIARARELAKKVPMYSVRVYDSVNDLVLYVQ